MSGARRALIVANDTYDHDGLSHLRAPAADAEALAGVLSDHEIGDFDVRVVHNEQAHVVQAEIEELFAESRSGDLLLLHFSCHGLKSESGELFLAARNTRLNRLASTATSADFVQRCMRVSRARSVVLLLDCCYGGAFSRGVTVRAGGDVDVLNRFSAGRPGGGKGRAVITASSAMEYAFEGDHLADDQSRRPSVFTSALVEGLASGEADRDRDGWVSLNELYDYVFDRVRERNPHQTPSRDVEMQGELYLARRPGSGVPEPKPLPEVEAEPPREVESAPRPRRLAYAAAGVTLAVAAIVGVVLIVERDRTQGGGDTPPADTTPADASFAATSPWRLVIEDRIGALDTGCTVTLTDTATGKTWEKANYGTEAYQMRVSGEFSWTASHPKCVVSAVPGAGLTALPTELRGGDSDAFDAAKGVTVLVKDAHDGDTCDIALHDATSGRLLTSDTVGLGETRVFPPIPGIDKIYVADMPCRVQLSR